MKGPISKDIKVGFGLDGLEVATFFAGLLVVIGLIMESGPDAWTAAIKHVWPHREVTGNVLVTIGVFGEVAIGLFIARSAKRAELLAHAQIAELNAEIAQLNAETERLRKENNEMALLWSYRSIGDIEEFASAMRPFAGTRFTCEILGRGEVNNLHAQINAGLERAGWIKLGPASRTLTSAFGVTVSTVATDVPSPRGSAATALADWLFNKHVSVYAQVAKRDDLPPGTLVIEIGPKPETLEQLRSYERSYRLHWPVTPPQA
jgi:hypothetical protein